jgi:hypothetical protein
MALRGANRFNHTVMLDTGTIKWTAIAWMLAVVTFTINGNVASADTPPWREKFDEVYRLADGENAKLIPAPFIDERAAYHREAHPGVGNTPGQYGFKWNNGKLRQSSWWSAPGTVASALSKAGIEGVDLDGLGGVYDMEVAGDWIVRADATREQVLADIERILHKATDGKIKVEKIKLEKDVIVARGKYAQKLITEPAPPPREPKDVHLFVNTLDAREGAGGGVGTLDEFIKRVAQIAGMKVVNEAEPLKGKVSWTNNYDANDAQKSSELRELLLKHVSEQTSLQLSIERRTVDAWRVIDTTGTSGGL